MGRKVGEGLQSHFGDGTDGSSSNTMSPGPRRTSARSGILMHCAVWPQYTNVTDRQTGQRSDSTGRTVLQISF